MWKLDGQFRQVLATDAAVVLIAGDVVSIGGAERWQARL